jgi:hypothetical protein
MAINRDPTEWFEFHHPAKWDGETYGILKGTNTWSVLRRIDADFGNRKVERVAEVDSRQTAIGFIKLLIKD